MFLDSLQGKPKIRDHDYVTLHLDKSEPRQVKKKGTKYKSAVQPKPGNETSQTSVMLHEKSKSSSRVMLL